VLVICGAGDDDDNGNNNNSEDACMDGLRRTKFGG